MPFNGSGVYSAPSSPGAFNPATTSGTADPTSWNALLADISAALSDVICRDGQSTITNNIPFNSNRITGLGAAITLTDAPQTGQVQNNSFNYAADTGTANAYAIALSPVVTSYVVGQSFSFKVAHANTSGSVTLAVNGLTAGTITMPDGSNPPIGGLPANAIVDVYVATVVGGTPTFLLATVGASPIYASLLTTIGDLIVEGASVAQRFPTGSAATVLTANGVGSLPSWQALPAATWATWSPADASGASLGFTSVSGYYSNFNGLATVTGQFTFPSTGSGSNAAITLPVAVPNHGYDTVPTILYCTGAIAGTVAGLLTVPGTSTATIMNMFENSGAALANSNFSTASCKFIIQYPTTA